MPLDYLVCRIASDKSFYRPVPYFLGSVEIRPGKLDSPAEREAIDKSLKTYGVEVELEIAPRLVAIVDADDVKEAVRRADAQFEEVLDCLDSNLGGLSQFVLAGPGFVRNMSGGSVAPLLKEPGRALAPSPTFAIAAESYPLVDMAEVTFGVKRTEIVERIMRSAHWSRKATWEANLQERVLYRWFSMEAAWKRDKDDDVMPVVMVALGFPLGADSLVVNADVQKRLSSHPRYRVWRDKVRLRLEAIRAWRNKSVHSGFRPWDIDQSDLRSFDQLSVLACARARGLLQQALLAGITTIDEAREYAVPLLEAKQNLINDVHGTIIYSLENPH